MVSTVITGKHILRQWHEEGNDQFRLGESKPSQEEVILKLETVLTEMKENNILQRACAILQQLKVFGKKVLHNQSYG